MEASQPTSHLFDEKPQPLSGTLNVLTILTFIGCGISYLSLIYSYFSSMNYQQQIEKMEEMQDKMGDNELANKMMQSSIEMMEKSYQYRWVLLISGLFFTTMCLIGALKMRKQKKSGYPVYVIGELAPIAVTAVLLGFSFTSGLGMAIAGIIGIVFVVLYTGQRKNLIYD